MENEQNAEQGLLFDLPPVEPTENSPNIIIQASEARKNHTLRAATLLKYKRIQDVWARLTGYRLDNVAKQEVIIDLFGYQFNEQNSIFRLLAYDVGDIENKHKDLDFDWVDKYVEIYFKPQKITP